VLLNIGAFLLVLGVLIFVHELGHFLAAKAVGIAVPRFSIGMGPATPLSFTWGETEYLIAWLPFGGYVKMASKEEQEVMGAVEGGALEEEYPPERMFENKSLAARILVISAGVIMNAIFACVTYAGLAIVYGQYVDPTTTLAGIEAEDLPGAAVHLADVPYGAKILRVNGDTVEWWQDVIEAVVDPTSERLRFDFASGIDPVILDIPGTEMESRIAVASSMVPLLEPRVSAVVAGQPAAAGGMEDNDLFLLAAGDTVRAWSDVIRVVEANAGDTLPITVLRNGETVELAVVPAEQSIQDPQTGEVTKRGRIGIERARMRVRYGLGNALVWGVQESWNRARLVLFTLKGIVIRDISPREIGGPILIGQVSGQFARLGLDALISFMAFLSVNLAILNLLPIPVLDGGHLVLLLLEGIRGKPISLALRIRLTQVGLFLLLGIMVLVVANDLLRIFGI
jgi:regulator of sigma E protease